MQIKRVLTFIAVLVISAACGGNQADSTRPANDTAKPLTTGTTATETGAGGSITSKSGDTRPRVATKSTTSTTATSTTTTSKSTTSH